MKYVLDTNILLLLIREKRSDVDSLVNKYNLLSGDHGVYISAVTAGEIKSLAQRNRWGEPRKHILDKWLDRLIIVGIRAKDMYTLYADIDTYSQGRHATKKLETSARNMGKNDLWIAATAAVIGATLLTTDNDFDHLDGVYFQVNKVATSTST